LVLFYLFTNAFIFDEVSRWWEYPAKKRTYPQLTYGVILGGMTMYDEENERVQYNRSVDRILQAIDMYKKGYFKYFLITGGFSSLIYKDVNEADNLKLLLNNAGIPDSLILMERKARNTYENAVFSKEILQQNGMGLSSGYLITSATHLPRSIKIFEKEGFDLIPYSTDRYAGKRKFTFDHLIIPNAYTLQNWDVLMHELIGYQVYKWKGYL
jgi:uncharacterized SAM-binding protein YcdF (DUF218 family)